MPEAFRLVFITRVIEGMNVEETAEILSLKPETVKSRLHRARNMLRDIVEKKIGPVVMEAFPFAGKRCERLTDAVLKRLGFESNFETRLLDVSGHAFSAREPCFTANSGNLALHPSNSCASTTRGLSAAPQEYQPCSFD